MTLLTQKGEKLRKAIEFVSEIRMKNREIDLNKLIDDACLQFDLSPKDSEFLSKFVRESEKELEKEKK